MEEGNKSRKPRGKAIPFEEIVRMFEEYKSEHGHMYIPISYVTKDGFNLGTMVNSIRSGNRKITFEQEKILNDMGFIWNVRDIKLLPLYCRPCNYTFEEVFEALVEYKKVNGNLMIPQLYVTEKGMKLGTIASSYRYGSKRLTDEQRKRLNEIGFVWRIRSRWTPFNVVMNLLKEYEQEYGNLQVPFRYVTKDNIRLGNIVYNIKRGNRKITEKERQMLLDIGFEFYN